MQDPEIPIDAASELIKKVREVAPHLTHFEISNRNSRNINVFNETVNFLFRKWHGASCCPVEPGELLLNKYRILEDDESSNNEASEGDEDGDTQHRSIDNADDLAEKVEVEVTRGTDREDARDPEDDDEESDRRAGSGGDTEEKLTEPWNNGDVDEYHLPRLFMESDFL